MQPVEWLPGPLAYILFWISQHQTLLAGLAAVAVGYATIRAIREQIASDNRARENERIRKLKALKAGVPMALSRINAYTEGCVDFLLSFLDHEGKLLEEDGFDELFRKQSGEQKPVPDFPFGAFEAIRATIEHSDATESETLHEILAYAQIQHSRFSETSAGLMGLDPHRILTSRNLWNDLRDVIGLQMHIERLYGWARNTTSDIRPLCSAEDAVRSSLLFSASENIAGHIKGNWPPNFPRKEPDPA